MSQFLSNVRRLGVKELYSIRYDVFFMFLIAYSFTYAVYTPAKNASSELKNASIAIIDEDRSLLSRSVAAAFLPPYFAPPSTIGWEDVDPGMDGARYTFVVAIPPGFEADLLRGRKPRVQILADATAVNTVTKGMGYIQGIIDQTVKSTLGLGGSSGGSPIEAVYHFKFNQNVDSTPFSAIVQLTGNITLLALFLSGAAIIREREHGTIEHLLVMPLRPLEIMLSKTWSNALVILAGSAFTIFAIIQGALGMKIAGSIPLFLVAVVIYSAAMIALGILFGTLGKTMPQFSLLAFMAFIILNLLSGGRTPFSSMPSGLQAIMNLLPTPHFMNIAQGILYRGAGLDIVWPEFAAMLGIGTAFFALSLWRFRRSLVA